MVVFKELFSHREDLNGSEAIVYSTLAHQSLWKIGEMFDTDGNYSKQLAKELLDDYGDGYIDCAYYTPQWLADETGLSVRNVWYVLHKLREHGYLVGNSIYVPFWIVKKGFIKLPKNTHLSGWQLVFYSIVKQRCDYYGGSIDTYTHRLAELACITDANARKQLSILMKKGYLFRDKKGHLTIK